MSKVALKGGSTGTGVYTIEAPSGSTDRTLTLPDDSGTLLFTDTNGDVTIGNSSSDTFTVNATADFADATITSADINGGSIDSTAIGSSSASSAVFNEFEVNPSDSLGLFHFHGSSGNLGVDPNNVTIFSIDIPYTTSGNGVWGVLDFALTLRVGQSANDVSQRVAHFKIIIARTGTNTGGNVTQADVQIEESTNAFSEVGGSGTSQDMSLSASVPSASTSTATVDIQLTSNTDPGIAGSALWSGLFMGTRDITFSF